MYFLLKLERIQLEYSVYVKILSEIDTSIKKIYRQRDWVAKILGACEKYGFKREFLKPCLDYSKSNSKGTRGIWCSYFLQEDFIYEISKPVSWSTTDRYFAKIINGCLEKISKDDVVNEFRIKN